MTTITALILCGGRGERLKPLTDDIPKALVKVNDKSIIRHQIERLQEQGITDIRFLTGAMEDKLKEALPDFENFYCSNTGTLDAINKGLIDTPPENHVIVLNGDIMTDMDLQDFIFMTQHQKSDMALFLTYAKYRYGVVDIYGDYIRDFREKPELPLWINGGYYYIKPNARKYLYGYKGDIEQAFPKLRVEMKLQAYTDSTCRWMAIDSVKDLKDAIKIFK